MILEVGNVGGITAGNILYFDIGNAGIGNSGFGNAIGNVIGNAIGNVLKSAVCDAPWSPSNIISD
jgi:hypothetical protein